jgi:hypothetical protein
MDAISMHCSHTCTQPPTYSQDGPLLLLQQLTAATAASRRRSSRSREVGQELHQQCLCCVWLQAAAGECQQLSSSGPGWQVVVGQPVCKPGLTGGVPGGGGGDKQGGDQMMGGEVVVG